MAEQILQHEAADACASIECGENEERFEHDREVIPNRHCTFTTKCLREQVRHAHRETGRPAGAREERCLSNLTGERFELFRCDDKAPIRDCHCRTGRRCPKGGDRCIDREVDARSEDARCDERHRGYQRLGQHCAVADKPCIGLTFQQFGRGARRDQCVEARNCTACDGDKDKREELAREHRSGTIDEACDRWHLERRQYHENADREREYDCDLHESAEVVTRREQQPHRQHRREKAVDHDRNRERGAAQREHRREFGRCRDPLADVQRQHQQRESHRGGFEHAVRSNPSQIDTHQHRNWNCQTDGDDAPRTVAQCVHDDQRQH